MVIKPLFKLLLNRPFFRGQDRIFNFLFVRGLLDQGEMITKPIKGNFKIKCDTSTWIGAKIFYTGDYEAALKEVFKASIKEGDYVLDIGANIGFHTLFFAELTGERGKVIAFEPVLFNYNALKANLERNNFTQIEIKNIALSHKNEQIRISAEQTSKNPGTFNLFDQSGDVVIDCYIGDELPEILALDRLDFIKIDVEGYESFVIQGLLATIKKHKPKIVFEFDRNYHQKTGLPNAFIFNILKELGYHFFHVYKDGPKPIAHFEDLVSGNILALPND
jgi:FkbM family methyltransferase